MFYFILFNIFYSYILNFCTISYVLGSPFTCDFLCTYSLSIVGGSPRFKNFIASDCFYVIFVHMTIKIVSLESRELTVVCRSWWMEAIS